MIRRESLLNINTFGRRLQEVFKKSPKDSPALNAETDDEIATNVLFKIDNGFQEEGFDLLSKLNPLLKRRITNVIAQTLIINECTAPSLKEQQVEAGVTLLFPNS